MRISIRQRLWARIDGHLIVGRGISVGAWVSACAAIAAAVQLATTVWAEFDPDIAVIDDMESWGSWRAGGKARPVLSRNSDGQYVRSAEHSLEVSFPAGEEYYGIVIRSIDSTGFSAYSGIGLWVFGDDSGLDVSMNASTFSDSRVVRSKVDWRGWRLVQLPFRQDPGPPFDPEKITQVRIYVQNPQRLATVYFDDLHLFGFTGDMDRLEQLKECFVRRSFLFDGVASRDLVEQGTRVKVILEIDNAWHSEIATKLTVELLHNEELQHTVGQSARVPAGERMALDVADVTAVPGRFVARLRKGPLGSEACDGFTCFTSESVQRTREYRDLTVRERDPVPTAEFPIGTYTGGLGTRFPGWTLDRTLQRIKVAGFHPVVWNEFTASWDTYEPERGQYNWTEMDELFGSFSRAGISAFPTLSFSGSHAPKWMLDRFTDGKMVLPDGTSIPNALSYFHDGVLAEAKRTAAAVARRYRDNPNIIGYVIGNEVGFNTVPGKGKERGGGVTYYGLDFNPAAAEKFRVYLRDKYGTIDQLNTAWRSDYQGFEAIDPTKRWFIEKETHRAHWLDFCLFRFEYFGRYFQAIQQAMKAEAPHLQFACAGYDHTMRPAGIARGGYLPALRFADFYFQKWVGGVGASDFSSYPLQLNYARGMAGEFWVVELVGSSTPLGHGFLANALGSVSWPQTLGEEYVRKVWASIGCGAKAVLPAHWLPGPNGTAYLVRQTEAGEVVACPSLVAMEESNRFLSHHGDLFREARPVPPRIALLDPMLTYILTAWDYNDPDVESSDSLQYCEEARSFEIMGKLLGRLNYAYDVIPQEDVADKLTDYRVLILAGANHLYADVGRMIEAWVRDGGALIVVKEAATFNEHCEKTELVSSLRQRWPSRVLAINGFIGYPGCFASWQRVELPAPEEYHALRQELNRFLDSVGVPREVTPAAPDPEFHDSVGYFALDHPEGHKVLILWSKAPIGVVRRDVKLQISSRREHRYGFLGTPYPCALLQPIELRGGTGQTVVSVPELADVSVLVLTDSPNL